MSAYVAVALLILVVLVFAWWSGMFASTESPVQQPAPSVSDSQPSKYDTLVELLQKTTHWLYFDEKLRSRQTIDFQLDPSTGDMVMKASVAKEPGKFKFSKAGGRDDTMQLLDPAKGDASAYATYIMYVDDKNLIIEEKTEGKITFQQRLSV